MVDQSLQYSGTLTASSFFCNVGVYPLDKQETRDLHSLEISSSRMIAAQKEVPSLGMQTEG